MDKVDKNGRNLRYVIKEQPFIGNLKINQIIGEKLSKNYAKKLNKILKAQKFYDGV